MKKFTRGEIAEIILSTLLTVGVITTAMIAPNVIQVFKCFKTKNARERQRIKNSINRLEKRGLIIRQNGNEDYFSLTSNGKRRAMEYRLSRIKIPVQKSWDKKWRLIMFDIPEEKKLARRAINGALKNIGCVTYQKSVFITPYPCIKEIDFVGNCFLARPYIKIVTAEIIEDTAKFRKHFKLK